MYAKYDSFSLTVFQVLCNSKNGIIRDCFLLSELDSRRRPETVSVMFSLNFERWLNFLSLHFLVFAPEFSAFALFLRFFFF